LPTINIPPKVRFYLYLAGILLLQLSSYLAAKTWIGKAEVDAAGDLSSLVLALAAAKTDLSGRPEAPPVDRTPVHRADL
jgi:hypothetical protein